MMIDLAGCMLVMGLLGGVFMVVWAIALACTLYEEQQRAIWKHKQQEEMWRQRSMDLSTTRKIWPEESEER